VGQYYIRTEEGVIYEMDATSEVVANFPGELTNFPIQSGDFVSDHYVNKNTTITFEGVISDIKSPNSLTLDGRGLNRFKSTSDYVNGLLELKQTKKTFTLFCFSILTPFVNCLFEDLTIRQNNKNGYSNGINSFAISFKCKQIRFGSQAIITAAPADDVADAFTDKSISTGNTQEIENEEINQINTLELIRQNKELLAQISG
jgi:hypothetical protein